MLDIVAAMRYNLGMINCKHCQSSNLRKRGSYKTKTATVQRWQCKSCGKTQSKRTDSPNYRLRKQYLAKPVKTLYCERMSLRGIARALGVNRKTVNAYFLREAEKSKESNKINLDKRGIISSYVQFDALETFEHTKRRPLGVWLSVRAKTGELVAAKVHKTTIRALTIPQSQLKAWNKNVDTEGPLTEFLNETKKCFNRVHTTLGCDGHHHTVKTAKRVCTEAEVIVLGENKKIDLSIRKLRNDISRLSRKSLCSTKKAERLQNHLDLYIDYHNKNRVTRQD